MRSDDPIYLQIAAQVQSWLTAGLLKPGDQLPTVRALAASLRVNFNTVARAYRLLDEAGLISTQRGRGTYILDQAEGAQQDVLRTFGLDERIQRTFQELIALGYSCEEINFAWERRFEDQNKQNV